MTVRDDKKSFADSALGLSKKTPVIIVNLKVDRDGIRHVGNIL